MNEIFGWVFIVLIFIFIFEGDELFLTIAKSRVAAYELCETDPNCYMNYNDYLRYEWALRQIEETENE
jgi:hypothetical protein